MPNPNRFPQLACNALLAALACIAAAGLARAADNDADVRRIVDHEIGGLVAYYKALHAAPELSHQETQTAAQLAGELRAAGYQVSEHIGKYSTPGLTGHGIVGVMRNGAGPTLLIRTELDALPVAEKTGLPYASTRRMKNDAGTDMPVMHACGHDVHVSALLGVARVMAKLRDRWSGTLELVGQPAEETIDGAVAMLNDGLYERIPRPDVALALHDTPEIATGTINVTPGFSLAASTQMDVLVRGVGGHGSAPQVAKDPVVLAANIIMQLQTIVSRETSPFDQAVVTVGTIHGGTKRNIIPDEVKLELTTRSYSDKSRQVIIDGLKQFAAGLSLSANLPVDKAATVTVLADESTPAEYNDPRLSDEVRGILVKTLGSDHVLPVQKLMSSEDVGVFGMSADLKRNEIPVAYFRLGAMDPEKLAAAEAEGKHLPGLHTSRFEPLPGLTIATGVRAMSAVATALLQ